MKILNAKREDVRRKNSWPIIDAMYDMTVQCVILERCGKIQKPPFGTKGPKPRLKLCTSKMWVTQKLLETELDR
jgi:hypothetical protein